MRALREVPRAVWLLACGTFVNMAVSVGFAFVFLYATGPRGLGAGEAGVLVGIGGAGLVAGNFTGGWYGDRFGHRRVLLVAAVGAGVLLGAVPVLPTAALYGALPLAQYASGVQRAAQSALVAVIVPEGVRRQAFAVVRAAANGGFTVGPVLGAVVATRFSYDWLYVGEGVGSAGLACWTARVVPAAREVIRRRPREERSGGVWAALRARPAVLVLLPAIVVVDVVYRQQYSTFPVFLAEHGMDARVYGTLLAVNGGMLLCLELPVAVVLRKRSPLRVIGAGLVLVGAGYGVLLVGVGLGTCVVMMALLTLGEALYKTTATAYVADQAPEHVQGRFQSLYAGASISGVVLAAPLGGGLYAVAPGTVWPVCAGLAVVAGGAVLWSGGLFRPRRPHPSPGAAAPSPPPHPRPTARHLRRARAG
ncbi:MFS transporter [Streptomyces sp. Act143]|uniref:MFS transporter n=1 Tax=Streptomyces sp. Act143 TaxID=2200760 RepID=UPI000D67AF16|nr:MFS transporter [Streptomyces sp. Act143]PWI19140.1 MFS transporter [Streptomyces sp. Act143]